MSKSHTDQSHPAAHAAVPTATLKSLSAELLEALRQADTHIPIHLKDYTNPHLETVRLVAEQLDKLANTTIADPAS